MLEALRNALFLPELRGRILFTVFILAIYRLVSHIPVPGVNVELLRQIQENINAGSAGALGNLVGLLSLLSGGSVYNFSVLSMGVYPYVTAQLIIQLMIPVIPRLTEMAKEGEQGRRKINRLTYIFTVPMAMLNAIGQVNIFESIGQSVSSGQLGRVLPNWGLTDPAFILPTIVTILTMTAGTLFAIWLGELITERGIGQGLSMIIFGGIVSRLPFGVASIFGTATDTASGVATFISFALFLIGMIIAIVIIQEAERRINVQYGKRVRGRRVMGGQGTHIPLKVNSTGMIPLIFAQALLTFPAVIAGFFANSTDAGVQNFAQSVIQIFTGGRIGGRTSFVQVFYPIMLFVLVIGFTYFYTDVVMQQQSLAENLQKQGGFIPGIRPGKTTDTFITKVMRRLTIVGALFLATLAILPYIIDGIAYVTNLQFLTPLGATGGARLIDGAGLLILVGVVLDTMRQLEAQLMMRRYEGFIR
ncbi:MAG: preprotein translocase subunit SecY [Chloroflexi bacterium]|nr:preprotein translocase subunit SecY [Chloroflexota bacterium]